MGHGKLGILVAGGPAPGINSVIGAATIRSNLSGVEVLGIQDGFANLMAGETAASRPLTIAEVSRIHFRGGSIIGISRANPTTDPMLLDRCLASLARLNVTHLITIGGDDTAYSAMNLERRSHWALRVVHVPKTIDNDLGLPDYVDTFGFKTARHVGADLVKNLMVDAYTTSRWYFVVAMGRKAGHLALGIGKTAGATLTLIPEEFQAHPIPLDVLVDTLIGAILKRSAEGRRHGVAVIAEGLALSLDPEDIAGIEDVECDEYGNVRLAEVDIGQLLKRTVRRQLAALGLEVTIVDKNIGYELRCADPIPSDMEYTRDLGYCAAEYLLEGGSGAMVSIQAGRFVEIPFGQLVDPDTGRTRVRLVDIKSTRYLVAREYMIRLRSSDFTHPERLAELARVAGLDAEKFRDRFKYVTDHEPPALHIRNHQAETGRTAAVGDANDGV